MIDIVYNGPVGNHLVFSPMRRISNYGMHTRGDKFQVHEADQLAAPDVFMLAFEFTEEPVAEPDSAASEAKEDTAATSPEITATLPEADPLRIVAAPVIVKKPAKKK